MRLTCLGVCLLLSVLAQESHASPLIPRVVTFNIASGAGGYGAMDYDGIAAHILSQNPDVVVLQEVHVKFPNGRGCRPPYSTCDDQAAILRAKLGMSGPFFHWQVCYAVSGAVNGRAGVLLLSKWPLVSQDEQRFLSTQSFLSGTIPCKSFGQDMFSAVFNIAGEHIRIGGVHIGGNINHYQKLTDLLRYVSGFNELPILAGDFNIDMKLWYDSNLSHFVNGREEWEAFPTSDMLLRNPEVEHDQDWILVKKRKGMQIIPGGARPQAPLLSDHALIAAPVFTTKSTATFLQLFLE